MNLLRICAFVAFLSVIATPAAEGLRISWTNNLLTLTGPNLPGKTMDIWYLEAFCRKGAHDQDWNKTTIPHKTTLLEAAPDGKRLKLRTTIGEVELLHTLTASADEIDIAYQFINKGAEASAIEWFQPACIRVD